MSESSIESSLLWGAMLLLIAGSGSAGSSPSAVASTIRTVASTGDVGANSDLALDSNGNPVISFVESPTASATLHLAICDDPTCSSASLTPVFEPDPADAIGRTSIALTGDDRPVVAFRHFSVSEILRLAVCNDPACSSPVLRTPDPAFDAGRGASVVIDGGGLPVISHSKYAGPDTVNLVFCDDAECTTATPTPVASLYAVDTSIALTSSGRPVIAYADESAGNDLHYVVCNNASCVDRSEEVVDASGYIGGGVSVAVRGDDLPVFGYQVGGSEVRVTTCLDLACTVPSASVAVDGQSGTTRTSMVLTPSGHPVLAYQNFADKDLRVAVCDDPVCTHPTLTVVDAVGDVGSHPSVALDTDGFPVVSYYDAVPNQDLKLAVCPMCTVPTRTPVDERDGVGSATSLALDAADRALVAYADTLNGSLELAVCSDALCAGKSIRTVDGAANVGFTSMVLDGAGIPVIAYYEDVADDLRLAICNDPTCTSPNIVPVDTAGQVGKYPSVALNAVGLPVISYYEEVDGDDSLTLDLKLATCTDAACSPPAIVTVDDSGIVGGHTSLVLRGNGAPVIAYQMVDPAGLRLALCDDAACGAPTIVPVDSGSNIGWHTSVALNGSGFPVVSYYDATADDLKLAVCTDADCTNNPTIRTVDADGDVGRFSSLALTADDFPVIAYHDNTLEDMKIAVCHDISCTNPTLSAVDRLGIVGDYTSLALTAAGHPVVSYYDQTNVDLKLTTFGPTGVLFADGFETGNTSAWE